MTNAIFQSTWEKTNSGDISSSNYCKSTSFRRAWIKRNNNLNKLFSGNETNKRWSIVFYVVFNLHHKHRRSKPHVLWLLVMLDVIEIKQIIIYGWMMKTNSSFHRLWYSSLANCRRYPKQFILPDLNSGTVRRKAGVLPKYT